MSEVPFEPKPTDVLCPDCGKRFGTRHGCETHQRIYHQSQFHAREPVRCVRCGGHYSGVNGLLSHQRTCGGREPVTYVDPDEALEDLMSNDSESWWVRYCFADYDELGTMCVEVRAYSREARVVRRVGRRVRELFRGGFRDAVAYFNNHSAQGAAMKCW